MALEKTQSRVLNRIAEEATRLLVERNQLELKMELDQFNGALVNIIKIVLSENARISLMSDAAEKEVEKYKARLAVTELCTKVGIEADDLKDAIDQALENLSGRTQGKIAAVA